MKIISSFKDVYDMQDELSDKDKVWERSSYVSKHIYEDFKEEQLLKFGGRVYHIKDGVLDQEHELINKYIDILRQIPEPIVYIDNDSVHFNPRLMGLIEYNKLDTSIHRLHLELEQYLFNRDEVLYRSLYGL